MTPCCGADDFGRIGQPEVIVFERFKALMLVEDGHEFATTAAIATGAKPAVLGQGAFEIDFNPTYFAHPKAADGLTLSHPDAGVRRFWVEHGMACRRIGAYFGRELGTACITNVWAPDGSKDAPIDPVKVKVQSLQLRRTISVVSAHSFTVAEELSEDGGPFVRLGGAVDSACIWLPPVAEHPHMPTAPELQGWAASHSVTS